MPSGKDAFTQGFNNNWWNPIDFLLPGTSALNYLFDPKGLQAANAANSAQWEMMRQQQFFNSQEAEKARRHSEYMSSTAIQRQMADYKAAGLNPWLAVQGGGAGASTPSSPSASASAGSAAMPQNKMALVAGIAATAIRAFLTKGK